MRGMHFYVELNMANEKLDRLEKLQYGDKIKAQLRHCNADLKERDQIHVLELREDNWYFEDGNELSYNWNIVDYTVLCDECDKELSEDELTDIEFPICENCSLGLYYDG